MKKMLAEMNMAQTLSEKDIWTILEGYFEQPGALISHQIETFDHFVKFGMDQIISQNSTIKTSLKDNDSYTVKFGTVYLAPPQVIEEDRTLRGTTPQDARNRDLNYDSAIHCDITEKIGTEEKIHKRVVIGRMPIMVGSSNCVTRGLTEKQRIAMGECTSDPGGYFIIKGNERVLVAQHRANYNQVMVQKPKDDKHQILAEVRSMSSETGHSVLIQCMVGSDNHTLTFSLPSIKEEIPCGIVFKALGILSAEEISDIIGLSHPKAKKYITYVIHQAIHITTQKEALKFIGKSAMNSIDKNKEEQYAWQVVETEMFPHLGISGSIKEQVCFLAHILHKMIATHVGLRDYDDKDNYANKRIDVAGSLMYEIFRNSFKNYVNIIKGQLDKRKQYPDILAIVSRMKNITADLHKCLATGNWTIQKNGNYMKTGVSQVLDRMTFGSSISHLRRILLPIGKQGKNTAIRQIHGSQFGFICPAECFDPSTPILTWAGKTKRADEIKIGDILIDDKGNPTRVKSTCAGFKNMYEIQHEKKNFDDYTVTDNHVLTLKSTLHKQVSQCKKRNNFQVITLDKKELRYRYKSFPSRGQADSYCDSVTEDSTVDITIEKYLSLSKYMQNTLKMFKCDGVNWPHAETGLDPYILGMWLGDGLSTGYGFACADTELLDIWSKWCQNQGMEVYHQKKYQYGIKAPVFDGHILVHLLKQYKLVNNKHIPKKYLINSRAVRLQLLAGLIDTDGSVRANGHEIRISQGLKNRQVIDDALFLCRSLGFSCHINRGKNSWTHNNVKKQGEYVELTITGKNLCEIPTKLPRKQLFPPNNRLHARRSESNLQTSFKLQSKKLSPFVGWQLEGNGRFLLSDFTVTHNTPEGQKVGLVLNLSLLTKVSRDIPKYLVRDELEKCKTIIPVKNMKYKNMKNFARIFLNNIIIGFTEEPDSTVDEVKELRKTRHIDSTVSVSYDMVDNDLKIFCDEGRLIRPLFTVENNTLKITPEHVGMKWTKLVRKGFVQYVDSAEVESCVLAMDQSDFSKQINDYCEIHPSMMLGVMASTIPFPDHSQSPRNCYQCLHPDTPVVMSDLTTKPIKNIRVGERVVTVDPKTGEHSITKVINQYTKKTEKQLVEICTESGRKIICTDDHPVLTSNGWEKACEAKDVLIIPYSGGDIQNYKKHLVASEQAKIGSENKYNLAVKGMGIFVPIKSCQKIEGNIISDITTESDNHSFIAGDSFCVHNSSMAKQALGIASMAYKQRAFTKLHILEYAQKPLVSTMGNKLTGMNDMPCGKSTVTAIASYTGFNQEDSIIMNQNAIERGLFMITTYQTITESEKKIDNYSNVRVCVPPRNSENLKEGQPGYFERKYGNYSLLDKNGIIMPRVPLERKCENNNCKVTWFRGEGRRKCHKCGTRSQNCRGGGSVRVKKGDAIVGKVMVAGDKSGTETLTDVSRIIQQDEEGYIDKVHIMTTPNGYKLVKIVIRNMKQPQVGDKLASRSAQKGTCGKVLRQEDMPYSETGICPEIVINPLCIPSRMTINQLIESPLGNICAIQGEEADATPFTQQSKNVAQKMVEKYSDIMEKRGLDVHGWENMSSGFTGEKMHAKIFMGLTQYQRLKHMVSDKMHARARGNVTMLTRQPLEGRSRDGGKLLPQWCVKTLLVHVMVCDTAKFRGILAVVGFVRWF